MALATLTHTGRAAIALAICNRRLHLAWGSGDEKWDDPGATLPSLIESTALVHELGRRTPTRIGFVTPDEAGDIVIPVSAGAEGAVQEARYRLVTDGSPTPFGYVQVHYDYSDAAEPDTVIREMGIFMDTEFIPNLPEGQRYFTPAEIANPGLLVAAQIILPPINRSPAVRQIVEFVLPI